MKDKADISWSAMGEPLDIAAWRKSRQAELLAARQAVPEDLRRSWNETMTRFLVEGFPALGSLMVGLYWPFKGEFDGRFAIRHFRELGGRAALPAVVEKKSPLQFREWWPGVATRPGVFGLPVPEGTDTVIPDALLIPPVGFDSLGYRLGYGGGYFDRTLAALSPQPLKIAVGFKLSRLPTIYPLDHDIPMDFIVTEAGVHRVLPSGLVAAELSRVPAMVEDILRQRSPASRLKDRKGYPSPPCYAHEFSPSQGMETQPMTVPETVALLNTLLEAERAGAKTLACCMDMFETGGRVWTQLRSVQRDEARNCSILSHLIHRLGGNPSQATGDFLGKVLALDDRGERLRLINRGQAWVARRIEAALPRIHDLRVRGVLITMRDSHQANIAACEALF